MGLRRILFFLLVFLVLTPVPLLWGRTGSAYIDNVQLRRGQRGDLLVAFRVQRAFDERLLDTLDSGLPVRFTYHVQVLRSREVLADRLFGEVRFHRTLMKDNLKDRYLVTIGSSREAQDVRGLAEAVELMTRVEGVRILSLESLGRSGPLLLRIKAKLQKFQLPFHLHYLFAFVSYWDVETDWYTVELPGSADSLP
jgi:hypothetical protein